MPSSQRALRVGDRVVLHGTEENLALIADYGFTEDIAREFVEVPLIVDDLNVAEDSLFKTRGWFIPQGVTYDIL